MRFWMALVAASIGGTAAAEPLTYEDAQRMALEANPAVQSAERAFEQAGHDVLAANGGFDPTFNANGGWDQRASLDNLPFFEDLVLSRNENWNASASISATAPTGTTGTLSGTLFGGNTDFAFDEDALPIGFNIDDFAQRREGHNFSLALTQELLQGVRLATNLQSVRNARDGRTQAELQLEKTRQQTLKDVADAYWNWVYAEKLAEISQQSVLIAEEDLRIGSARVEAGEAAPVERTRLEASLVQARSSSIDSDNNAQQAADALLLLLGQEPGRPIEPGSTPGDVPALELSAEKVTEVAMAQSLDLRIAQQRLDASKMGLADARHRTWPTLNASLNAGLGGASNALSDAFRLNETMFPTVGVSGNFSVPLGNRAATGQSRRAAVQVVEDRAALSELQRQIRSQVAQQVRLIVSAAQKVDLADANLRLAIETLSAEEALYDAGRSLLKDVLEARKEVDRTKAEAAKARTDYRVAEAELLRLQGRLVIE